MKKVKYRAGIVLVPTALIMAGLALFVFRLASSGESWALFRGNLGIYRNGILNVGTLYDRNGVELARAGGGAYTYADDSAVRAACLHAVGDFEGNIGSGALTAFNRELAGYSFVYGTYSRAGSGGDVTLTIDADLNVAAKNALGNRAGAVLVMNYKTGEVLAMASSPSYDPASPPDLSSPEYEGVYLNRAISSVYTPGSVFKIVTLAAALENIGGLDARVFDCAGSSMVGGGIISCTGEHGAQSIAQAFSNSCNCAFAEISLELGAEIIGEYAKKYGLTSAYSLNGLKTAEGSFSLAGNGTPELAWSGIGQYEDLVCPFSVLCLSSAIANDGVSAQPLILKESGFFTGGTQTRLMAEETAGEVARMMGGNVSEFYGSWNFPGLDVCAKTGTAEVGDGAPHAWITGFVRDEDLPLAFTVIVENAGSGLGSAAPVANAVIQAAAGA